MTLARRVLLIGGAVLALLLLADLVSALTGDWDLVQIDREGSLFTWARTTTYTLGALAAALAAGRGPRDAKERTWAALAVVLAVFSLDDQTMLHERLEASVGYDVVLYGVQSVAGLAVLAVLAAGHRHFDRPASVLVVLAGAALVLAQASSVINGAVELSRAQVVLLSGVQQPGEFVCGLLLLAAAAEPARARLERYGRGVTTA